MTENVILPRRLVDQVMDALEDSRVDYDYHGNPFDVRDVKVVEATKALRNALEQPQAELEPVATVSIVIYGPQTAIDIDWNDRLADLPAGTYPLYTHPKLERKPLSDEQIEAIDFEILKQGHSDSHAGMLKFARAVEAAHGIVDKT